MFISKKEKQMIDNKIFRVLEATNKLFTLVQDLTDKIYDLQCEVEKLNERIEELEKVKDKQLLAAEKEEGLLKDMSIIQNYSLDDALKNIAKF